MPFIQELTYSSSINMTSVCLDTLPGYLLDFVPWPLYPYKPFVQFSLAHTNTCIFIKFFVTEKNIRAAASSINGEVWKDACVEFFIAFDESGYYNLEFNAIGTILAGFGAEKMERLPINEATIRKIKYGVTINNQNDGDIHWELTAAIPMSVFSHHHFGSLKGMQCKANFYKCGDDLEEPHFISWAPIESSEPDFHLPQFFGILLFE